MKKPKTRNHGTQTEAAFLGWIKSLLRSGSQRWRPKNEAKKLARKGKLINPKTGRECNSGVCSSCGDTFLEKELEADHIHPVIPIGKTMNLCSRKDFDPSKHVCLSEVAERMYVEIDGYQMLCNTCHKEKTSKERSMRRNNNA